VEGTCEGEDELITLKNLLAYLYPERCSNNHPETNLGPLELNIDLACPDFTPMQCLLRFYTG
jgi:hypothetical protein